MRRCPRFARRFAAAALLVGLLSAPARAQPGSAPAISSEDRARVERIALARARGELSRQVLDLPIRPGLTVGHWVSRDSGLDRALRLWLRARPAHGSARSYSDGTCEVDVRLEPQELHKLLVRLLGDFRPSGGEPVTERDLEHAARSWTTLWAAGSASIAERGRTNKPHGWEDVTLEGIELARRAAAADASRALLEVAGALKVTTARRLREFLESSPEVRTAVEEAVARAARLRIECALDQVAVAEASLRVGELIRILTDVHQKHYRGDVFEPADFREMALLADRDQIEATGLAAPPRRELMRGGYALIEYDAPAWVEQSLEAAGRFRPDGGELPQAAVRIEMARFEAVDRLRQQVEALVIQEGVTVSQLLGYHPWLKDDVVTFLGGARMVAAPATQADGSVEVRMQVRLRRLWEIVRRGMNTVELEPPTSAPTTTRPGEGEHR
jgi:hypothetical protein